MAMVFIQQQVRQVLFFLDNAVYSLISKVYELILYLSNVNLINNNNVLVGLISRIYLILGIFMLFKVSFSVIQYIIDPNAFSDSSKGFGKLITNTLVSLILLVSVPFIFTELYEVQRIIISSNAIPNLILGLDLPDNADNSDRYNDKKDEMVSMAKDIEFAIFGSFATISDDPKVGFAEKCKSTTDNPTANVIGSADMIESGCFELMEKEGEMSKELSMHGGKLSDFFKYESETSIITGEKCPNNVCDDRNFSAYASLLWWAKSDIFVVNYIPFVPTVIGGYLLLLLVTFAIDIAVRAFKLMFLQAVAPISIVSYIDPKESISNSKLYKWIMETLKTFLSLFLRLAVVFLIVQLVNMLTSQIFLPLDSSGHGIYNEGIAPSPVMHIFVYIFLILGLFAFAKQVPKMIENLFPGFTGSGDLNLNPFKSGTALGALAGGAVGGALGSVAGAGANFLAGTRANRESIISSFAGAEKGERFASAKGAFVNNAKNLFSGKGLKVAGSALAGGATGAFSGGKAGFKGGKPNFSAAMQGKNAAIRNRQLREQGYGVRARSEQSYNQAIGYRGSTAAETGIGNELKQARQEQQNWNAQEEQIRSTIATHAANYQGGKYASQIQMITKTQQTRDKNGELRENRYFESYDDFIDKQVAAQITQKDISSLTKEDMLTARNDASFGATRSRIETNTIDQKEFDNVASLVDQQIHASGEANRLESTVKRLESGKKNFNEKPK